MTTQEMRARRYSSKCRRLRRQRQHKFIGIIAAVLFLLCITSFVIPGQRNTTELVAANVPAPTLETAKAPEMPQAEAVQEPVPEETPEPVLWRDDIVSDGRLLSHEEQEITQKYCAEYGVPYALGLAMAEVETHFDPDAVSEGGDYGLMQINPINHGWLLERGLDVHTYDGNIASGILIISEHLTKYNGDKAMALMAYNCGPTGAQKLWDVGVYETDYTRKVLAAYDHWTALLEE